MRKVIEVKITDEGRDKGKTYVITEMPARRAEKWASRALIAISRGAAGAVKLEIDEGAGWAGVAAVGLRALGGIQWDEAEPLMDEMMTCVAIKTAADVVRPLSVDDDVEEVATLTRLRTEALQLHMGFSFGVALSKLGSAIDRTAASPSTPTSPAP